MKNVNIAGIHITTKNKNKIVTYFHNKTWKQCYFIPYYLLYVINRNLSANFSSTYNKQNFLKFWHSEISQIISLLKICNLLNTHYEPEIMISVSCPSTLIFARILYSCYNFSWGLEISSNLSKFTLLMNNRWVF